KTALPRIDTCSHLRVAQRAPSHRDMSRLLACRWPECQLLPTRLGVTDPISGDGAGRGGREPQIPFRRLLIPAHLPPYADVALPPDAAHHRMLAAAGRVGVVDLLRQHAEA